MPKFVDSDVLDLGINRIKTNATAMLLLKAYAAGDNYATVDGNKLASAAVTTTDFTLGSSGNNRTLTGPSSKSATASASSEQHDTGTATAGAASTLTNTGKSYTTNQHAGRALVITAGTGSGQTRRIASNTATVLTVDTAWTTNPDATSVYKIVDDLHLAFVDATNSKVLWVTDETSNQIVVSGNTVNFPNALVYTAQQPT